jgi:hypothetical protein
LIEGMARRMRRCECDAAAYRGAPGKLPQLVEMLGCGGQGPE